MKTKLVETTQYLLLTVDYPQQVEVGPHNPNLLWITHGNFASEAEAVKQLMMISGFSDYRIIKVQLPTFILPDVDLENPETIEAEAYTFPEDDDAEKE